MHAMRRRWPQPLRLAAAVATAGAVAAICVDGAVAQSAAVQARTAPGRVSAVASSSTPAGAELVASVLPHTGATITSVGGVSCVSATLCFAVGTATVTHGRTQLTANDALIWRYDGRSWTLSDRVPVRQSSLESISCPSRSFCLAVGLAGNPAGRVLAMRWNGRSWSQVRAASPPSAGNGDALASVDCLSRSDCIAIGGINLGEASAGLRHALVERWRGHALVSISAPSGGAELAALACPRDNDCWAPAYPSGPQGATKVVAHFNGHRWATAKLPIPMEAAGISCRSQTMCWIIGDRVDNGLLPAAARLAGGSWKSVPMPSPQRPDVTLQGIACASSSDCWAVGGNALVGPGVSLPPKQAPFAERWDGSAWHIAKVTEAGNGFLAAASCAPSGLCVAGGSEQRGAKSVPIAAMAK